MADANELNLIDLSMKYLFDIGATDQSGSYFKMPPYQPYEAGSEIPEPEWMVPMEAVPMMPMEREQALQVQASPVVQNGRVGASVNANTPLGRGDLNVNTTLLPGEPRADINYSQPLARGNLNVNAAADREGLQSAGLGYGQPVGNSYLAADARYQRGQGMDMGVNYQGQSGGLGLRYQPKGNAVMLNATKRF